MNESDLINTYPNLHDKVILNVDDNEMNHLVISKLLARAGLKIISVFDGSTAVAKLQEGLKPDAVLMDIEMPVMGGVKATEIIRKEIDPRIPIIINSGYVDALQKWRLSRLGVKDFLEKPYSMDDILRKLSKNISATVLNQA